jgi:hypothetical protein
VPVIACPKCPTQLKVPDGVSGNTRCPKCGTVFPVVKPAFEVVEDRPAPKPATKITPKIAPPPPQFEVLEDEPKKRVVADEDDEPRKKRSRDDDDDDDEDERPKSRKKRSRNDEDEDDRRRKKKKKSRSYEDDFEDDWEPRLNAAGAEYAKGKTGALLLGISFWLNLAAFGLLALYTLIAWLMISDAVSGSPSPRGGRSSSSGGSGDDGTVFEMIAILPGLIGLAAWIVGLIGCSFAIAGPRKSRGMAITATVFASVHLIMVGVTFGNIQDGPSGLGRSVPGTGKVAWLAVASALPALDAFLPMVFYQSKEMSTNYVIGVITAVCEVGRLLTAMFLLKAMALAARDFQASERSGYGIMIVLGVIGGVILLSLFVVILLHEGKFTSLSTYLNLGLGTVFLMYLGYTLMMLSPAIGAMATKDACARRS